MHSIVQYLGPVNGGKCGYCRQEDSGKSSIGIWGHGMSASHYNALLDRGMRRSGRYIYKPINTHTCCPQYTIRLDVNKFTLSRTQKRILRRMNDFLQHDIRPKKGECEEDRKLEKVVKSEPKMKLEGESRNGISQDSKLIEENSEVKEMNSQNFNGLEKSSENADKNENTDKNESTDKSKNADKNENTPKPKREPGIKKKTMRRERALKRMQAKGINVEEFQKKRRENEQARRRTLESYLLPYDEKTFKHKLEVRLVKLKSPEFDETVDENFAVYEKYQTIIHNDDDCTRRGYMEFLANSPLFDGEETSDATKSVALGSYHQLYLLDGRIIAAGVLDVLPRCLSAKYFYYDPDFGFLSLGTYAALREIHFVRQLSLERPELHYYYMGYYIDSCPKMRYKGAFRPSDLLCDNSFTWVPLEECVRRLRASGAKHVAFAPDKPPPEAVDVDSVICIHERTALPYAVLKSYLEMTENESYVDEYAQLVGPAAKEILLFRTE